MAANDSKKEAAVSVISRSSSSESSTSLKSPRTARFAEATSVDSPIDGPTAASRAPYNDPRKTSEYYMPQPQPSDVGFGYIGDNGKRQSSYLGVEMPTTPRSPLKSALRTPGAPPRKIENPLSPTWKEEELLDKREESTEKEQAKDLKIKVRVRIAKMALRATNFSCSLIVLSMLSSTFSIFNATRELPPRNNLPPWASNTKSWPAITLLCISCVSLFMSVLVFYGYWSGGHKRAEKAGAYYSMFAIGFFCFSIVMWGIGAGVLQQTRNKSNGQDIWGWSCKNNARKTVFQNDVHYDLVCRLQNWSLVCCLIEVIVEVITITIYGVVFYRFYSKRRLRKSMASRDAARSDLYLAQLRSQSASAPNTPGLASPRDGGYNPMFSPRFAEKQPTPYTAGAGLQQSQHVDDLDAAEQGVRYVDATASPASSSAQPFKLQTPPIRKATPKVVQDAFQAPPEPAPMPVPEIKEPTHQPAAPGEQQYESVPIPGAYAGAINSPTHVPGQQGFFGSLG